LGSEWNWWESDCEVTPNWLWQNQIGCVCIWLINLIWFPVVDWVELVDWMCDCQIGMKVSCECESDMKCWCKNSGVCECLVGGCRCSVESGVSDSRFGE
jgi:hypothetical protein